MHAEAIGAVADLAWAGQQARAIARATELLAAPDVDAAQRVELLDLRAESRLAIGEFGLAQEDGERMLRQAQHERSPVLVARAQCRRALVQTRQGDLETAAASARAALAQARKAGDRGLEALALLRLSEAEWRGRDARAGLRHAEQAAALFEQLGDVVWTGRALWSQACALANLGRTAEREQAAARALALATQAGDRFGIGGACNILERQQPDLARRLAGLQRSLAAFEAAGYTERVQGIRHNLAITYMLLGLHHRALRLEREVLAADRGAGDPHSRALSLGMLCWLELHLGRTAAAQLALADCARVVGTTGDETLLAWVAFFGARIALADGDAPRARREARRAVELQRTKPETSIVIVGLAAQAESWLMAASPRRALAASRRAVALLQARESPTLTGIASAVDMWWTHYRAARAAGAPAAEALAALDAAYRLVCDGVAALGDEGLRRSWFGKVEAHRQVIAAWRTEHARTPLPHLQAAAGSLREPFERLAEGSLRMNELHAEAELRAFLIEEAGEIGGAARVLLVLDGDDGAPAIAGSLLPAGEDPAALLAAIAPWLAEARRTRVASLRHGPDGADAVDQRSCIVAPLVAQHELLGFVYADIEGLFGRFESADRDLIAMLASQAAVALANLRASAGLEGKVAERTAEARAAQGEAEQRAGELAIVNGIQRAMNEQLGFQAIVDTVGEKLREVFASKDLYIGLLDADAKTMSMAYAVEHGERLPEQSFVPRDDRVWYRELRAGRTLVARNAADYSALHMSAMPGTDMPSSGVYVPVMVGERYIGQVGIESFEREDAFGESAVRLLQTVVASMGVALENARLFDETQRLFKQSEQRAAELAIVNSVQAALAAKLDVQAIHQLVGDKVRDVFDAQSVLIGLFDHQKQVEVFTYSWEKGQYADDPPRPLNKLRRHLIETRQTLLNNHITPATNRFGATPIGNSPMPKSAIFVPMVIGDEVRGYVSIQNVDRFDAFTDADVRLLETLTGSLAVAFENARLFDVG